MDRKKETKSRPFELFAWLARTTGVFSVLATGIAIGIFVLLYSLAGEVYDYQDSVDGAQLPEVDAIVCLAGGRGRIAAAGDIWYRYWENAQRGPLPVSASGRVPILYISGMGPASNWNVFTRQLRRGVLNVIRPDQVVLETESSNTESNASYLVRYATAAHWKKILLMTSRYHMRRAKWIFEVDLKKSGRDVGVESLSVYQEPFEPGEWRNSFHGIRVTLWEYLKWIYYYSIWRP